MNTFTKKILFFCIANICCSVLTLLKIIDKLYEQKEMFITELKSKIVVYLQSSYQKLVKEVKADSI